MAEERLPDAELEVLACLWRFGESTARAIREAMEDFRPLGHSSVVTLLNRLEDKGFVKKRKGNVGKAFLYKAARRPERTQRHLVKSLLERAFAGNGVALIATLFQSKPPTQQEVEELQGILDGLRQKRRGKGKSS